MSGRPVLLRLLWRLDRIKLPLWILGVPLFVLIMAGAVVKVYVTTEERLAYAATATTSAMARAFNGPLTGPTTAEITTTETFVFFAIVVALINTFFVVRHTRRAEETGQADLLHAGSVGRATQLIVTLGTALLANAMMGALVAVALMVVGLPAAGSVAYGAGFAALGWCFAGVAALSAQLSQSARLANGLAAAVVGGSFIARAFGDAQGTINPTTSQFETGWLSWISPLGWASSVHPYADNDYLPIVWLVLTGLALAILSYVLCRRRDLGSGLIAERPSRDRAPRLLLSWCGLAIRLQKGIVVAWAVSIAILGLAFGGVVREASSIATNGSQAAAVIQQLGGTDSIIEAYFVLSFGIIGIMISAYAIQALLRLRSEEAEGHFELIMATTKSRLGWMAGHVVVVVLAAISLIVLAAVCAAVAYAVTGGDRALSTADIMRLGLLQLPAILVLSAVSVLAIGLIPRLAAVISWVAFATTFLLFQFGKLLDLPDILLKLSPFAHTAVRPAEVSAAAITTLIALAIIFMVIGFRHLRRRDILTS